MFIKRAHKIFANARQIVRLVARRIGLPGYQIHQIYLPQQNLVYIPIPKNACSSIKHALFQIEYGNSYDYDKHREWGYQNIHDFYNKQKNAFTSVNSLEKKKKSLRFTVVRDPVDRFLSCYGNRVLDLKDLKASEEKLKELNLPLEPDLNTFVKNLNLYRKSNSSIRHHTEFQSTFLGGTLDYLDEIYPIKKMDSVTEMLNEYDKTLNLRKEKSGGTKIELNELSEDLLEKILTFYDEDYKLLRPFYSKGDVIKKFTSHHQ